MFAHFQCMKQHGQHIPCGGLLADEKVHSEAQNGFFTAATLNPKPQRVHVGVWDILGPESRYMGTPLGPKYIPYTYMDSLKTKPCALGMKRGSKLSGDLLRNCSARPIPGSKARLYQRNLDKFTP